MSRFVNVAAAQFSTKAEYGAPDAGRIVVEETRRLLESLKGYDLDLLVLSEGIYACAQYDAPEAPENPGPLLSLYSAFAAEEKCVIAGSAKTIVEGNAYNSIVFYGGQGELIGAYHKNYSTQSEIENGLKSGRSAELIDTPAGKLAGVICFDLNFEKILWKYRELKPDIIVFPSLFHGGFKQALWAYECRAFFVSAVQMTGGGILDPHGQPVALMNNYVPVPKARVNLDRVMIHLDYNRDKFPEIEKKYGEEVTLDIPPYIGSAILYSNTEKRTAEDIVDEFQLERLDDYFAKMEIANERNH